jgi:hypothetical protein
MIVDKISILLDNQSIYKELDEIIYQVYNKNDKIN